MLFYKNFIISFLLILSILFPLQSQPVQIPTYEVERVVDGDTLRLKEMRTSLRLLCVDTEELFHPVRGQSSESLKTEAENNFGNYYSRLKGDSCKPIKCGTPFGEKAKQWLIMEMNNVESVWLEYESRKVDTYGREVDYPKNLTFKDLLLSNL